MRISFDEGRKIIMHFKVRWCRGCSLPTSKSWPTPLWSEALRATSSARCKTAIKPSYAIRPPPPETWPTHRRILSRSALDLSEPFCHSAILIWSLRCSSDQWWWSDEGQTGLNDHRGNVIYYNREFRVHWQYFGIKTKVGQEPSWPVSVPVTGQQWNYSLKDRWCYVSGRPV